MDHNSLTQVLSGVPLPMVMIGADALIMAINPQAEAIIGSGHLGRHHAIALRQPGLLSAIDAALNRGETGQARYGILGPSHEETYHVTVSPVRQPGAFGRCALCAFQDITEQEQISQFRRDFVANVSHELRTPLTALSGFIETLRGAARNDAEARARFLGIMARETGRMNRLVDDLLSLSRVEAEERKRPATPINLAELLTSCVTALRPVADAADVVLDISMPDDLPMVPGDGDQIMQVFHNLVENAVKYGGAGKTVSITVSAQNAKLRVDVADQGAGIAAQHLPRLTERFYRVDTHRSREQGGTGLGLAIVKHIVHRHRGKLVITSEPGTGSCFSVLLPCC